MNTQGSFFFHNTRRRPCGRSQIIDGAEVYDIQMQTPEQVAYTLNCDVDHVYHHIQDGNLDGRDIGRASAKRATYRITRASVLEFLARRKEGAL